MSFREKSAWAMAALLACAGLFYLVWAMPFSDPQPPITAFAPFLVVIVVGSILLQVGLAVSSPREANARADERERPALSRAGHWSGVVLAAGVVTALMLFLVDPNGSRLFHYVMLSLIAGQLSEYAFQIVFLRAQS